MINVDTIYNNLYFFLFLLGIIFICIIMFFIGYILGGKSKYYKSIIPFEGGIPSLGNIKDKNIIKFYIIAIISLIFDIEIIYIYPWAISSKNLGIIGFLEFILFVIFLILGLIYTIKKGVFDKN